MAGSSPSRVGYLVNAFPVASETFLVNELRGVEAAAVPVAILALSRRQDRIQPSGTDEVRAEVFRPPKLLPFGWLDYVAAHLRCLIDRPLSYLRLVNNDALRPLARTLGVAGRTLSWNRCRKRLRLFLLAPMVAGKAKRAGVGHLHAHYAKEPLEVAARVSWLSGLTYSFAAHAKDLYTTPAGRLSRRLAKARFAVTCHPHGDQTLRAAARPQDRRKIHLIPHGLDPRVFRPAARSRRSGLIVAAGRMTPKKGLDTLIEACSLLQGRVEFSCVILGEGRLRSRLERSVRKLGLTGTVRLPGFVEQKELATWLQRAQVVTLPARVLKSGNRDGIPNVLLEAMACGAPVVSTSVGSITGVVEDGVNGILVPPDSPEALASALSKILTAEDGAEAMGARGRQAVEELDFRKSGKEVARLHRRQLPKHQRPLPSGFRIPEIDSNTLASSATQRVGRSPQLRPEVETAIARSVAPGLQANFWRPDLQRMTERRLWDEVFKARRANEVEKFARSRGVHLDATTRVLDVGCGRGGLSVALRARGISVVSLDLRLRNCHVSRLRGRRYDLAVPVVNGRAETLPFKDKSFDAVCLLEVLEHVADPVGLLSEARRVCRPRGVCVVTVVNRWAHLDPHYHLWGINFLPRRLAESIISYRGRSKTSWKDNQRLVDMHYYSFPSFQRFAKAVGFEVHDPWRPQGSLALLKHDLGRRISLGFNTVTLVLEPR